MAEGLFLHSYNEQSKRFAILDEEEEVAFLYLSTCRKRASSSNIKRTCFLYLSHKSI